MRPRRGASAVEFALVAPVLLVLLFAIVDWSLYTFERMNVQVAVNRSVRLAAGRQDPTGDAQTTLCDGLADYGLSCTAGSVRAIIEERPSGPVLTVTATLPFSAPVGIGPLPTTLSAVASTDWYYTAAN